MTASGGVAAAIMLVYVPHFIRIPFVIMKLKEDATLAKKDGGDKKSTSIQGFTDTDPRGSAERSVDSSSKGQLIRRLGQAHLNSIEGFAPFAAATILACIAGVPTSQVEFAVTAYVASRVVYIAVFAAASTEPLAYLRSSVWGFSMAMTGYLLYLAMAATK